MTPVQKLNKDISELFDKVGCLRKVAATMDLSYEECRIRRRNYLSQHCGKMDERSEGDKKWRSQHKEVKLEPIVKGLTPVTFPENYDFSANPEWVW